MKPNIIKTLALAFLWLVWAFTAQAKINVVATLPDFGAIAREIGGDNVDVTVLAKATEDPHFVDARPSFVVKLRQADVLIDGGAELEIGWLPPLLQNARNPKIEVGQPGRVQASHGIRLMEVPAQLTRAAGDVHAMGNPHFMGAIWKPRLPSFGLSFRRIAYSLFTAENEMSVMPASAQAFIA